MKGFGLDMIEGLGAIVEEDLGSRLRKSLGLVDGEDKTL